MLIKAVLFLCATTLIIQLFPRYGSFKYQFAIGKPWAYELITAPFALPIYKDKAELEAEKRELLRNFEPYLKIDYAIVKRQMAQLRDSMAQQEHLPKAYQEYIQQQIEQIYRTGVLTSDGADSLLRNGYTTVLLIDSTQHSHRRKIKDLFTVRAAYEHLLNKRPAWANEEVLKSINLNFFLTENLHYDHDLSERNRADFLQQLSTSEGMIQVGERIIDRGEIVTKRSAALLNSLKIELDKQKGTIAQYNLMWVGEILLVGSLMLLFFLYLLLFRPNIFGNTKHIIFLLMMNLLMVSLASFAVKMDALDIYVVPFALLPILVRVFFDSRTALFIHIITILQISLIVPDAFGFMLFQIPVGMAAVSTLKDLAQRSQLASAAIFIFVCYSVMYLGYSLLIEGNFDEIKWRTFLSFGISSFLLLFAYGLIYVFEKMFGFVSNVTLVELSNVNSSLLQLYAEKAPGSFQHSMQVANLVTEAAKRVNGNALIVRIGAIYHDIGKMTNPMYFTENQLSGVNPLEKLDYREAAQLIIGHVDEGVKIARKHNLPGVIIDFIRTHHGESVTRYFYNSFKNRFPDAAVDESVFRYKGPAPWTKEQAILMMADAVEATSRSLSKYSDESIDNMVDTIIDKQISDGLFRHAKITFMDVETVKSVFKEKLKTIYHTRISYPELKQQ
jgi:putative nucleotidyltransferase with HDIG domain